MKKIFISIGILLISILIVFISLLSYHHYTGPVLNNNTKIGFYGHKKLSSFRSKGMTERKAAAKIYEPKQKFDWKHPIKYRKITYYFPKDMPIYTRHYLIFHSKKE